MHDAHVTNSGPETVVFVPMHGPRTLVPEALERAAAFVEHYGLVATAGPQILHITTPETDESLAEWELWLPIAGGAGDTLPGGDGIGVKRVEADTVAVAWVEPDEFVGQAYRALEQWAAENALAPVGLPLEVYTSPDDARIPERHGAEIRVPVTATAGGA